MARARSASSPCCAGPRRWRSGGPRWLCSIWTDLAAERQRESQLRTGAGADRAAAAGQRRAAPRAGRPGPARPGLGPVPTRPTSTTSCAARSTCRRASTASSRSCCIEIDPPRRSVLALRRRRPRRACSRPWAGCCAATRARWTRPAVWTSGCFAVLLSGVGLATAHSRMEGLRRQVRDADRRATTARNWASACRWAWPAFRTPRTPQDDAGGGLRSGAGRGAAPRRQPRDAGGHPLRGRLKAGRRPQAAEGALQHAGRPARTAAARSSA